ncbi:hypothetical protein N658DRAFT_496829 [Parathielavia hyrcaniae]|uniref:Uncharacterized protein n=1 Tax=Parathielavia hyrcaniae TaxID=113614 RepID=A0AAN6T1B6_9PEZI|nr:hypothetical protein N658DRAFT_496829 [Parathielavia hyrcaniae]
MRQAARRVAIENSRLRALLSSRGVTSEQVDQYLASFDSQPSADVPTMALASRPQEVPNPGPLHQHRPRQSQLHQNDRESSYSAHSSSGPYGGEPGMAASQPSPHTNSTGQPSSAQPSPADDSAGFDESASVCYPSNHPISALDTLAVVADASIRQTCCGPTTQCTPAGDGLVSGHVSSRAEPTLGGGGVGDVRKTCCGPTTQCTPVDDGAVEGHVPPRTEPTSNGGCGGRDGAPSLESPMPDSTDSPSAATTGSHLEMSCTAAAHIMANIYRDGNEERAREAMGCSGSEECFVKNTVLFQLLDNSGAL